MPNFEDKIIKYPDPNLLLASVYSEPLGSLQKKSYQTNDIKPIVGNI